jgi:hypothetical protein
VSVLESTPQCRRTLEHQLTDLDVQRPHRGSVPDPDKDEDKRIVAAKHYGLAESPMNVSKRMVSVG